MSSNEIYFQNNLAHKISDNNLFSGTVEDFKKSHISYSAEYLDGFLTNESFYYNFQKKLNKDIRYKKIYYSNNLKVKEETFLSTAEKNSTTEFDENGKKKIYEFLKDGKVVFSQNFLNGKLNGKLFNIDKKGDSCISYYSNGKMISTNFKK
ncbi:hypothetical protein [Kaistella jeonii]|uniref:hypothetical protein n=1 Tax=Kaistella jeonii TaxID=266749 RepID=UPI000F82F088|nr:hypothetical protein [Kaistella jeonii]